MATSKFLQPVESRPNNLNVKDKDLWQTFNASIEDLTPEFRKFLTDFFLVEIVPLIPAGQLSGGSTTYAPYSSTYVTVGNDANLSAERAITAGSGITITDNGANSTLVIAAATAASASSAEAYVTIGNTAGLAAERAITAGTGITITDNGAGSTVAISTDAYRPGGTDVALADGGTGASLADPNADRILFWDDSAGGVTWLTAGSGLTITDTTMTASGSSVGAGYIMARA